MTQAVLSGTAIGAMYVLMSIGFALSLEIADIVNAAQGAVVVGGMYVTLELMRNGVPVYVAVVLTGVGIGLVSWLFYALFMRSARSASGHRVQLVYTLLLFSALTAVYQLAFGANIQALGKTFSNIHIAGGYLTTAQVVAIVLAIAVPAALYLVARYAMIGKLAYVASRYPLGARSVGAPVDRIYLVVFVLAGVLAGVAGGVLVTFQPVQPTLGLQYTVVIFLVALVARTNLLGCLVIGFAYGVVQSVLGYQISASTAATLTLCIFLVALLAERLMQPVRHVYRRVAQRAGGGR
jgi:branched-chain amino acid transport system permease protein